MEMFLLWRGFSALLGLSPLCWAQSLNAGLQVGRGQFVYVTSEDLRFDVQYNVTSCKVEVVMNEPVTQRVGVFTPQVGRRTTMVHQNRLKG